MLMCVRVMQEVIGSDGEAVTEDMYYDLGQVTEFGYATEVDKNIVTEYKMQYLNTLGEVCNAPYLCECTIEGASRRSRGGSCQTNTLLCFWTTMTRNEMDKHS